MQYRKDKNGSDLSVLGFGCMRFTKSGGNIDLDKAEKEIMEAYGSGVNYFDTAYIYSGSEAALGKIIEKNRIRENIKIATKLPQYLISSLSGAERCFKEQLSRLRTDYVDYYLMHHLTDIAMWEKLKSNGVLGWLEDKKSRGEIRNIGFSYHGNVDGFMKILNDYDWDMCQIQYNYFDRYSQAGEGGLKAAAEKGIPVVIMEPLRGGKLVSMIPDAAKDIMSKHRPDWSPAEWGFRWLYNQPEVTVVLSGMNSSDMVRENCRVASEALPGCLTDDDLAALELVTEKIKEKEKVGCTECRYCMPCPKGVDIPGLFRAYNAMAIESKGQGRRLYFQNAALTKEPAFATQCIGCGQCEKKCPQGIPIRKKLKEADKAVRPLPYKIAISAARGYMFRKGR